MALKSDIAITKFREGYNCAQSVLFAHCDDLHLDRSMALRLACGFGAGMGRKEEVCGAVSGGILVLGLRYGRGEKDDRSATEITYAKTQELMERFQQRHGTFICRHLLNGCDFTSAEGRRYFMENDLSNRVCIPCIESMMAILEEI
jgi:C_GCAxxG_C_C family probable redox protein